MEMTAWMALVGGFLIGVGLAWAVSSALAKSRTAAAEARVEELRKQIEGDSRGFKGLRKALEEAQTARSVAETHAGEVEKRVTEQLALLEDAKMKLTRTFDALAADALAKNNQGFLTLAEEKFRALAESAGSDLSSRQQAIGALVKPLGDALTQYQGEAGKLENIRQRELGSVGQQLSDVAKAQTALSQETIRLANALSSAQVRGRWGEITLRRCAELAGLSDFCDFEEQVSRTTEEGRQRPDMIVRMPAGRQVIVDSKVPMSAYDDWRQAASEGERDAALQRHADNILGHVSQLASREYWAPFESAEFVVMFIPNDTFLAAATQKEPGLVEIAMQKRIVFATPSTFYGLLRAVEYGWRQQQLAENARRISEVGQVLCDRIATFIDHLEKVGVALTRAMKEYSKATGSFNQNLLPKARQFKQLGAGGKKELKELPILDVASTLEAIDATVEAESVGGVEDSIS